MATAPRAHRPGGYGDVLDLVRSRAATSRADIARLTGLSPSTASARVDTLLRRRLVREEGDGPSSGGRRPRRIVLDPGLGTVAAVDLSAHQAALGLVDAGGTLVAFAEVPVDLAEGPEATLATVTAHLERMREPGTGPLMAACVGVPGPVAPGRDVVVSAARMPGWNGTDVRALVEARLHVPTVVENDANLVALGELALRPQVGGQVVAIKIDSGIGCGVVVDGALYRGASGMAGDISHSGVPGSPAVPCSCGRTGCLDVVASGSALVQALRDAGREVDTADDLVQLIRDADPLATNLLRESGERVGAVLATVVSFFNPSLLVLAGQVSSAAAFTSAVTSTIYASCLPATTESLEIAPSQDGVRAGVHGAARVALDTAFADESVEAMLRDGARR